MTIYTGTDNNDTLNGSTTDDTIYGKGGKDTITGGLGNDLMYGDAGADTYKISKNDGQDTINNYDTDASIDIVNFNFTASEITDFYDSGYSLVFKYGVSSQLTVVNYFYPDANYRLDKFVFTDATWTLAKLAGQHKGTANGDILYGFNGVVNVISGLQGNDSIYGGDLNDKLNGGDGIDTVYGYAGDDTLTGETGDDNLQGMDGNDTLNGGDGNDTLLGGNGNDSLVGGLGNDSMQGNAGSDNYTIAKADGQDTIYNYDTDASVDIVKFTNVASTDIKAVYDSGYSLVFEYGTTGRLSVNYYFYPDVNYRVDKFQFTDTTWTIANIAPKHNGTINADALYGVNGYANTINGLAGNDTIYGGDLNDKLSGGDGNDLIYGYAGNDTLTGDAGDDNLQGGEGIDSLVGGAGNDSMQGNGGSDTYTIAKTDGEDIIYNYDTDASVDIVKFTNVASTDIKAVYDSANNLVFEYGTTGKMSVYYYFSTDTNYRVDKFIFSDNVTWTINQIAPKHNGTVNGDTLYGFNGLANTINGLAGNDVIYGGDLNDTLSGNDGNDSITGNAGNDTISGGLGNDSLVGNAGTDTYLISKADGQDIIYNYDTDSSVDVVKFANVASTDVKAVYDSGLSLVLEYGTSQLTLYYYFSSDVNYRIDKFQFTDTTWTIANIAPKHNGTTNADTLYGFNGMANTINGLAGNDVIYGGDQNDTLNGGDGSDSIYGNAGNDKLTGAQGADYLQGDAGADTYVFADTDGQDVINNYDTDNSNDVVVLSNITLLDLTGISITGTYHLVVGYGAIGSQFTANYYYYADTYKINQVQLADGNILKNFVVGTTAGDVLSGTAGNDAISGLTGVDTAKGGAGDDLYFVDETGDKILENLNAGTDTVLASANYTLSDNIENLALKIGVISGTGNGLDNKLTGNDSVNNISGMGGNDLLDGGLKGDTMSGGTGSDTYMVDNVGDKIVENANQGNDSVQTTVSFTLATNVENLLLLKTTALNGTGNDSDNRLTGNSGANILDGGAGNDRLDGDAGADTLKGGDGDDTYLIDSADTIQENTNAGTDTVLADFTYTLGANLENLILGGTGAINGTGNALVNNLTGNSGNNSLNGGAGADTLIGKGGSDVYFVDDVGDVVQELVNEGIETVNSSISYTLGANLEKLTLTGTAAKGTGNTLVNTLKGNASDNTLDGGSEADAMEGGAGNDTYLVDNIGDTILEALNAGTDSVISSVSYSLAYNIENLTLTGAALKGTGNNLANTLLGNANNNSLNGGLGVDTMKGGAGNDTYVVNISTDIVEEKLNEGTDLVSSTASYILGSNVENLTLAGSSAIDGTGNSLNNILIGNAGNNKLDGLAGIDTLTGGDGADVFVFSTLTGGADTALDMVSGTDKVQLSGDFNFGNGDNFIDGGVLLDAGSSFTSGAELVIVKADIIGAIDRVAAATAIGSASAAYAIGDTRLFVVDNNADSLMYKFTSANANATVEANELTLVGTLQSTAQTALADYLFA